jgi:hypothetical protein
VSEDGSVIARCAVLTGMMIWVILAAVAAAASSRVPIPPRHAQVMTCSKGAAFAEGHDDQGGEHMPSGGGADLYAHSLLDAPQRLSDPPQGL